MRSLAFSFGHQVLLRLRLRLLRVRPVQKALFTVCRVRMGLLLLSRLSIQNGRTGIILIKLLVVVVKLLELIRGTAL